MNDLVDVVGLESELDGLGEEFRYETNFEFTCSKLASSCRHGKDLEKVERRVEDYFFSMQLPDDATIYDHLLCGDPCEAFPLKRTNDLAEVQRQVAGIALHED